VASTVFRQADAPKYLPGLFTTIALTILLGTMVGILSVHHDRENAKADRGEKIIYNSPSFRYTP
jgi:hypothetical protein